jgi:hypothetical protein
VTDRRHGRPGAADSAGIERPVLFHFSTAVWGPWHTGAFLTVNLPSLLAAANLPAFAARHKVLYRIFTSAADARQIAASPAFQRARELLDVEFVECITAQPAAPIAMHHAIWRRSIVEARRAGAMILFIPPDVVWSNGSFAHVAELAASGKRAIVITYLRVLPETCLPEVERLYRRPAAPVIDAPARGLVDLAMRHIHPLALTYMRDSANFPVHPEFVLWPVRGEGLLMRVLVREMFAFDPQWIELNEQALVAHRIDPDIVHIVTDSDDLFSLSLAPADQDIEWYAAPQTLQPLKIASWWLGYDSPLNDLVAAKYFHIHAGPCTPAKWRSVGRQSDVLIQRITGLREVLRVLSAMARPDIEQARRVLAAALAETRLARVLRGTARARLLLPDNRAVIRWLLDGGDAMLRPAAARRLTDLILDHAIIGEGEFRRGEEAALTTARGTARMLTWRDTTPLIDGVALRLPAFEVGPHLAYVADRVLPATAPVRRAAGRVWAGAQLASLASEHAMQGAPR